VRPQQGWPQEQRIKVQPDIAVIPGTQIEVPWPGWASRTTRDSTDLIRQGFALEDAVRGLVLLHDFTIGFCVEEQAVAQVTASGDDSYSPDRRAELILPEIAPLAVEAGRVIFGDGDTRFTDLLGLLLETIDRLRPDGS
jgi:hypothetical protein